MGRVFNHTAQTLKESHVSHLFRTLPTESTNVCSEGFREHNFEALRLLLSGVVGNVGTASGALRGPAAAVQWASGDVKVHSIKSRFMLWSKGIDIVLQLFLIDRDRPVTAGDQSPARCRLATAKPSCRHALRDEQSGKAPRAPRTSRLSNLAREPLECWGTMWPREVCWLGYPPEASAATMSTYEFEPARSRINTFKDRLN